MPDEKLDKTGPGYWQECPYPDFVLSPKQDQHCIEQNLLPEICRQDPFCARAKHLIETHKILTKG